MGAPCDRYTEPVTCLGDLSLEGCCDDLDVGAFAYANKVGCEGPAYVDLLGTPTEDAVDVEEEFVAILELEDESTAFHLP